MFCVAIVVEYSPAAIWPFVVLGEIALCLNWALVPKILIDCVVPNRRAFASGQWDYCQYLIINVTRSQYPTQKYIATINIAAIGIKRKCLKHCGSSIPCLLLAYNVGPGTSSKEHNNFPPQFKLFCDICCAIV